MSEQSSAKDRFRAIVYGRIRRLPKLPVEKTQSSESSSTTGDGSEDCSSLEDEDTAIEFDSGKDLCIEIKVGKDGGEKKEKEANTNSLEGSWMRWDPTRSTRSNQDIQRETEDSSQRELQRYLSRKNRRSFAKGHSTSSGANTRPKRGWAILGAAVAAGQVHQVAAPIGGIFMKLEQDWRETHMAYLQHKSSIPTTQPSGNGSQSSTFRRPGSAASVHSMGKSSFRKRR